jgi:hypothetical protein
MTKGRNHKKMIPSQHKTEATGRRQHSPQSVTEIEVNFIKKINFISYMILLAGPCSFSRRRPDSSASCILCFRPAWWSATLSSSSKIKHPSLSSST